ncbi:hypothetical protein BN381_310014 [Candidatus Microthrix parvicella RN1]|uniref:Uncharacterized protein n=1 Tax=Candidatus Neomicrothrix parvicella RN1 TaxID=1229780 RepID=R4YZM3_9ACTN|nr:hypothetical protein BN381_310014 [Candidatus Microthrix parvicella RN1]
MVSTSLARGPRACVTEVGRLRSARPAARMRQSGRPFFYLGDHGPSIPPRIRTGTR